MENTHRLLRLLEIEPDQLLKHCLGREKSRYTRFEIPKRKKGEKRSILAPNAELNEVLARLNQKFHFSFQPSKCAHGFIRGRSIVSNASPHVGAEWVLNIDLSNFFPTITENRVFGAIFKWNDFMRKWGLGKQDAFMLARLCCHDGRLPQGAPTSPLLANLVSRALDRDLARYARSRKLTVSRYADDISFSPYHSRGVLHSRIYDAKSRVLEPKLTKVIEKNGFSINHSKTRLRQSPQSLEVTGLVVNRLVNIPRKFTRQLRAMLHAWEKYGLEAADREFRTIYDNKKRQHDEEALYFDQVVLGKIQFISMVRGKGDPLYLKFRRKLLQIDDTHEGSLPVDLEDFSNRPDFDSLLKEDIVWRDKRHNVANKSYLNKWIEERMYIELDKHTSETFHYATYKIAWAERSFLHGKHSLKENRLKDFVGAWDLLTSEIGAEMRSLFAPLDIKTITVINENLPQLVKELLSRGGFDRKTGHEDWTVEKMKQTATDKNKNSKGINTLYIFAGFAVILGEHESISKHKARIDRILEKEPQFFRHFDYLRNTRNLSKASDMDDNKVPRFRERFYKVFRALIQTKEN